MASVKHGVVGPMRMYTENEQYIFEPIATPTIKLIVNRVVGTLEIKETEKSPTSKPTIISGIVGCIELYQKYMVLIDQVQIISYITTASTVYRITSIKILPFNRSISHLSEQQLYDESNYLLLLEKHLSKMRLYFSNNYALTLALQQQQAEGEGLWERSDKKFVWNNHVLQQMHKMFIDQQDRRIHRFMLPIINGYVGSKAVSIGAHDVQLILVSRRSHLRAGTRYFSRGIDEEGNVSNYVETEQIVIVEGGDSEYQHRFAHVQTRGSIPLLWAQIVNLHYKPRLYVPTTQPLEYTHRHFQAQLQQNLYVSVVNLVNSRGYEASLGYAYEHQINRLISQEYAGETPLRYHYFDFHAECKHGLQQMKIIEEKLVGGLLRDDLLEYGYYYGRSVVEAIAAGHRAEEVVHKQTGIFRANCVDCLDRTNVVQLGIAAFCLQTFLKEIGVQNARSTVLQQMANGIWVENANALSADYSGSAALKTDLVRFGAISVRGALIDGYSSLKRYICNNFCDGHKQDAFDLFLGRAHVDDGVRRQTWSLNALLLPMVTVFAFLMMLPPLLLREFEAYISISVTSYLLLWLLVMLLSIHLIRQHGYEFIDWPSLVEYPYRHLGHCSLDDLIIKNK